MRVVIHEEPAKFGSYPERFLRTKRRTVAFWIGVCLAAVLGVTGLYVLTEDPGERVSAWVAVLVTVSIIAGALAWVRSRKTTRSRLVKDALWVSGLLAFVGPFDRSGISLWAAWAEGDTEETGAGALLALTPRSFELVPLMGPPQRLSVALEKVSSVDLVFADRESERGISIRLTDGRIARLAGKPSRALAEQLGILGADVVSGTEDERD